MLKTVASVLSRSPSGCKLVVLIYHRVPAEPDPLLPGEPHARVFDWQMREIAAHFRVCGLATRLRGSRKASSRRGLLASRSTTAMRITRRSRCRFCSVTALRRRFSSRLARWTAAGCGTIR